MSDADKPEGPDDDGWGEAADEVQTETEEAAEPLVPPDWKDPAMLDERVAALRASEQMPASGLIDVAALADEHDAAGTGETPGSELADSTEPAPPAAEDEPQWAPPAAPDKPAEEQPLPAPSSDMLAAAGVIAKKNSKSKRKRSKSPKTGLDLTRKQMMLFIALAVLLVVAGVVAILGWFNSQNYYLVCGTKSIRAEKGTYWPGGQSSLPGAEFRSIAVPSDVLCQSQSYDNRRELENAFLAALLEQSTKLLTTGGAEQVDAAEKQLEQALLLTRDPERGKERKLAERLKGDVSYWRGAAEVERAVKVLQLGAKSFEEAAAKRPRHSSDSSAWAEHARYIAEEIEKGPRSLRDDEKPVDKPHFEGLMTPETNNPATPGPNDGPAIDAGVPTQPPADADLPPIDAALPRGGVLL